MDILKILLYPKILAKMYPIEWIEPAAKTDSTALRIL